MIETQRISLGTAIKKWVDPQAGPCDCGEPGHGYIRLDFGYVVYIDFLQDLRVDKGTPIAKCRTHYMAISEGLIKSVIGKEAKQKEKGTN